MSIIAYGVWNGSQVLMMQEENLVLKDGNTNITLDTISLKDDFFDSNSPLMYNQTIHGSNYTENSHYIVGIQLRRKEEGVSQTDVEFECKRNGKHKPVVDTSLWKCENSDYSKEVDIDSICNGYRDTENDCNDPPSYSDESKTLCAVDAPLPAICTVVVYLILGFVSFLVEVITMRFWLNGKTKNTTQGNIPLTSLHGEPTTTKKIMNALKSLTSAEENMDNKNDAVKKMVTDLWKHCSNGNENKKTLMILYSLSLVRKFRGAVEKIMEGIIDYEKSMHPGSSCQYIHCIRACTGDSTYLSGFVKDIIEKDECASRCMRSIRNFFTFNSYITNTIAKISMNISMAVVVVVLYYYDHLKDLYLWRLFLHVDSKILRDVNPKEKTKTV